MKIVDISNDIFMDQGQPTYTSIPAIAFWVRSRVGTINNLLYEDFTFDSNNDQILDGCGNEVTMDAAAVLKQMYKVYDLEVQVRNNMNALANDFVLSVEDNGSVIKRVNRNEISKTLISMRKDEIKILNDLITAYRIKAAKPSAVSGDDVVQGFYTPQYYYFRRYL